jgi:hypothetical protein
MTHHPEPAQSKKPLKGNRQPETTPPLALVQPTTTATEPQSEEPIAEPATPESTATPTEEAPPWPSDAELTRRLKALAARANSGDPEALVLLRDVLDRLPHIAAFIGDLAKYSETLWIELLAPQDLLLRESIRRRLAQLKRELAGEHPTAIERLLIDNIAACHLAEEHANVQVTVDAPSATAAFRLKRTESAQKRLMSAIKTLALVRTSMSRGLVPLNAPRLFRPEPNQRNTA